MKVRCRLCGVRFDCSADPVATYCPFCDSWVCAKCYESIMLSWLEKHGATSEDLAKMRELLDIGKGV